MTSCANCKAEVRDKFCASCGQSVRSYRVSLWRLVRDFLAEAFDLDGRLVRTLRTLFGRPGRLAQAFSNNQRASYVSPVRMYLFSSLLFFFLLAVVGGNNLLDLRQRTDLNVQLELDDDVPLESVDATIRTVNVRADPQALYPFLNDRDRARLDGLLAAPYSAVNHEVVAALVQRLDTLEQRGEEPGWLYKQGIENLLALADDVPGYFNNIIENLPLAMFVLLPFYALLLKLLFFSSGRFYAEHLVFALYLHVLAFLIFSASFLLPSAEEGFLDLLKPVARLLAIGYLGVYTYLAMRHYYTGFPGASIQAGWPLIWRFVVLGVCYLLLLAPALLLVMAFSFISL